MLSENIKTARKSKGLSQEELAVKLNVVRQTISKWEQGLSVPDSDMLIALSDALATPVSALLGEFAVRAEADDLKAIAEKLEIINLQLARKKENGRKLLRALSIFVRAAENTALAANCAVRGHGDHRGSSGTAEQSVSGLELQRSGNCRRRRGVPRL